MAPNATLPTKTTQNATTVQIGNVVIPASMAGVIHGRKYREFGHWVLTSIGGVLIATFPTEDDLDHWWNLFQKSRGRTPKVLAVGRVAKITKRPVLQSKICAGRLPK